MIRVKVPLDLHAVASGGSSAFALATPLRLRELLVLTVREAIGARAPHDKVERSVQRTLNGLERGDFSVSVDGRLVCDADAVVVCDSNTAVRFYLSEVPL